MIGRNVTHIGIPAQRTDHRGAIGIGRRTEKPICMERRGNRRSIVDRGTGQPLQSRQQSRRGAIDGLAELDQHPEWRGRRRGGNSAGREADQKGERPHRHGRIARPPRKNACWDRRGSDHGGSLIQSPGESKAMDTRRSRRKFRPKTPRSAIPRGAKRASFPPPGLAGREISPHRPASSPYRQVRSHLVKRAGKCL